MNQRKQADKQSSKQHERDARQLRERLDELEPLLTETQQERFQIQKQSEQQRQERSELLLRVFKDVNKFLGTEVSRSRFQPYFLNLSCRSCASTVLSLLFLATQSVALGRAGQEAMHADYQDHSTPANFGVFRDTLLHRLRSLNHVRSDFEKRVKETEASVDHRMA